MKIAMLSIKKIVCPTDFSEPSLEALAVACDFARHFSAELIVVHVIPPVPVYAAGQVAPANFDIPAYQREIEISFQTNLQEHIDRISCDGVSARGIVQWGDAADVVVEAANSENADLIVISTHGRTGLKRLFFGSVAEKVVRNATRPVLTIRKHGST
jgi:universal stress protein A